MRRAPINNDILVIDRQDDWRTFSAHVLEEEGFRVNVLDNYDYASYQKHSLQKQHSLVVLGCASIGNEERKLIEQVLATKQPLLVLCTSVPWETMRTFFLLGVRDIADKPNDPNLLSHIVQDTLRSISLRDGYRAVRQASRKTGKIG